jgi:hypothetical protein
MKTSHALLLAGALSIAAAHAELLEVHKTLRNNEGEVMPGILVHALPRDENPMPAQSTRTDGEGAFSFVLPHGAWFIQVDDAELLARGYFCVPGWNPEGPDLPLIAVPLVPRLTYEVADGKVTLVASFDWIVGLEPIAVREYRIERSEDFAEWEPIGTLRLTEPPLRLEDPALQKPRCFYRVIDLGARLVLDLAAR